MMNEVVIASMFRSSLRLIRKNLLDRLRKNIKCLP